MFENILNRLGLNRSTKRFKARRNPSYDGHRRLRHEYLEDRRMLATLTVNVTNDNTDAQGDPIFDDGLLTLRDAIAYVNGTAIPIGLETDQIVGQVGVPGVIDKIFFATSLSGQTITLNEGIPGQTKGKELTITNSVIIDATMLSGSLTIAGTGGTDGNVGTGNGTTVIDIVTPADPDGESFAYVLAGLTITGGDDDDNLEDIDRGGGITFRNGSTVPDLASILGQVSLTIRDSFVTGNHSRGDGGGIYSKFNPEQIYSLDSIDLVIERSVISGNTSDDDGGGITVNMPGEFHADATGLVFTLSESVVESNEAVNRGGGIFLASGAGGVIDIKNSTVSGNKAGLTLSGFGGEIPNSGGGIYAYLFSGDDGLAEQEDKFAKLTITGTTVNNNDAGNHGGGIFICTKREDETFLVRSNVEIRNSTLSGNSAGVGDPSSTDPEFGEGGGIHIAIYQLPTAPNEEEGVDVLFEHVTITDNHAIKGGGIFSLVPTQAQSVNNTILKNTIVSGNDRLGSPGTHDNIAGAINLLDSVFNLIGTGTATDPTSTSNIFTDNPGLLPLALNGGPTKTHAPNVNSLVIDKGEDPFTGETFDQRGDPFDRVVGGRIDIGAVELQPLADFDHDSDVDGTDFLIWQRGLGIAAPNAVKTDGDADNDTDVDAADLVIWQSQYGLSADSAGVSSSMQGGGSGSSSMMMQAGSSLPTESAKQGPTEVGSRLSPEKLFQLQKMIIEVVIAMGKFDDQNDDGLLNSDDLLLMFADSRDDPSVDVDRLAKEVRFSFDSERPIFDASDLLVDEEPFRVTLVDNAIELL